MMFICFRFNKFSYADKPWNTAVITIFGLALHILGWGSLSEDKTVHATLSSTILLLAVLFFLCHIQWILTEPISEVAQHATHIVRTVSYWLICDIIIDNFWMPYFNYVCGSTLLALTILMISLRLTGVTEEVEITISTDSVPSPHPSEFLSMLEDISYMSMNIPEYKPIDMLDDIPVDIAIDKLPYIFEDSPVNMSADVIPDILQDTPLDEPLDISLDEPLDKPLDTPLDKPLDKSLVDNKQISFETERRDNSSVLTQTEDVESISLVIIS
ncbi:uncharacterized protein LOC119661855 [Teleopsis dalmanni]|uniref:uncharacterized protein LOC119661855 n=1 Tax=Teleopsis dalmanni TaxID=139649 RepID=UPI0018CDE6BC|nr:uncharacterized protein LOC119661855 [Teleopsis dalmanni]